ncbi:GrpB family protein [Sutcliffiella deserti]|uniref:GrpB family protein n=1 Tax=Sutcliffiella deserti TaxID=2875501 RepID=UPI001CBE0FAC|nr:GrpB family protein [Sutcliffiella deserti]
MRKTTIMPWTKEWVISYNQEEKLLSEILREELTAIFHIGSTSVPVIGYAKPIIDILVVVKEIEKIDQYNEALRKAGYKPKGENGIAGRRYFSKGKDKRTHHVHIFQVGHENIKDHLDFKAYLMANSEDAKAYGDVKLKLAKQFPESHHNYQVGKQKFVNELMKKARGFGRNN